MKKAVIESGPHQFLVAVGDQLAVDRCQPTKTSLLEFKPLLVIEGESVLVGQPHVADFTVSAKIIEPLVRGPKVTAIRFKAKKRVHKRRGQRHQQTIIEIKAIKAIKAKPQTESTKSG